LNHENVSDIAPFVHTAPVVTHLNRTETYVLLEAARAPGSVLELERLQGSEEARFTAAKRLELDGFLQLIGPSMYQVTRKARDPRLLAQAALQWIRPSP
jgi:hypothetical protein